MKPLILLSILFLVGCTNEDGSPLHTTENYYITEYCKAITHSYCKDSEKEFENYKATLINECADETRAKKIYASMPPDFKKIMSPTYTGACARLDYRKNDRFDCSDLVRFCVKRG